MTQSPNQLGGTEKGEVAPTIDGQKQPRVLIVSPEYPADGTKGNRVRILSVMAELERLGAALDAVWFIASNAPRSAALERRFGRCLALHRTPRRWWRLADVCSAVRMRAYRMFLHADPVDHLWDARWDARLESWLAGTNYDLVIINYVFYSRFLEVRRSWVKGVIETHDIMGDREQKFRRAGRSSGWWSTTRAQEAKALRRADEVWAIQDEERAYFQAQVPGTPVARLGHMCELAPRPVAPVAGLIFIGSDNTVNVDGLGWFLAECWPAIRRQNPRQTLGVVGSVCRETPEAAGVFKHGIVDRLDEWYAAAGIVIAPLRVGSGLKIKTVEAFAHGKAVIGTTEAFAGLPWRENAFMVHVNTVSEWAGAVARLTADPAAMATLGQQAWDFAERYVAENRAVLKRALAPPPQ